MYSSLSLLIFITACAGIHLYSRDDVDDCLSDFDDMPPQQCNSTCTPYVTASDNCIDPVSCACVDSFFTSAATCLDCILPLIPDTGNCSASVMETEWQESINEVYEQCLANGFAVNSVSLSYAPTATGGVSTTSLSGSGMPLTTAASDGSTTSTAAANGSSSGTASARPTSSASSGSAMSPEKLTGAAFMLLAAFLA